MQKIFAAVLVLGIVAAPYGPWIPCPDCGDADRLQPLGVSGRSGLNASVSRDSLAFTWDGDRNQELRLRFVIDNGTPTIAELAARKKGSTWGVLATNATPEFPRRR
jgi:hypothetical protein